MTRANFLCLAHRPGRCPGEEVGPWAGHDSLVRGSFRVDVIVPAAKPGIFIGAGTTSVFENVSGKPRHGGAERNSPGQKIEAHPRDHLRHFLDGIPAHVEVIGCRKRLGLLTHRVTYEIAVRRSSGGAFDRRGSRFPVPPLSEGRGIDLGGLGTGLGRPRRGQKKWQKPEADQTCIPELTTSASKEAGPYGAAI